MATTPANLMQTAVNAATTLVAAYVNSGLITSIDDAKAEFATAKEDIFTILQAQPNDEPRAQRSSGRSGAPSKGRGKSFTPEEARAIDLAFGKFKGVTLGELENMTGSECAEYGYGEGEKSGLQYLKYLANNDDPKGSFIRAAATAVLEDRRSEAA